MTREEWKNYREFDRMRLEMNGGGAGRRADPATAEAATGRIVSDKEKDVPIVRG